MRTMLAPWLFALLLCTSSMSCGGDDVEVLECEGSCACDDESRTCACMGGTECRLLTEGDVTFVCEGNATCDLSCGHSCRVECIGRSGCTASMGDGATGQCSGAGECDFVCQGACAVDCPGASMCTVRCADGAACEVTSCGAGPTECGNGVLACRTVCPD